MSKDASTLPTEQASAGTTTIAPHASPDKGKGKGKAKAAQEDVSMEEDDDEDDDEEDDDEDGEGEDDDDDEMEEDFSEIDPSAILASRPRRAATRNINYASQEALQKAGLTQEDEDDEDE